jgi:hypothetical protein
MLSALHSFLMPAPAPVQQRGRAALRLEDLGLAQANLQATAVLTPILEEDVQLTAEQAIQQANPDFIFSDAKIEGAKKFMTRVDTQIQKAKAKIAKWEGRKADITALMPAISTIIQLRLKGQERRSLQSLSTTPPPPRPAPSRTPSLNLKRRRLEEEFVAPPTSDLDELDWGSDNDFDFDFNFDENEAPEPPLNVVGGFPLQPIHPLLKAPRHMPTHPQGGRRIGEASNPGPAGDDFKGAVKAHLREHGYAALCFFKGTPSPLLIKSPDVLEKYRRLSVELSLKWTGSGLSITQQSTLCLQFMTTYENKLVMNQGRLLGEANEDESMCTMWWMYVLNLVRWGVLQNDENNGLLILNRQAG